MQRLQSILRHRILRRHRIFGRHQGKARATPLALHLFATSVLVVVVTQGSEDWNATDTFDPMLESGKWAIRFLLLCLTMTPLQTYLGRVPLGRGAIRLRKPAGLWAFAFALLHVLIHAREVQFTWLTLPLPRFLALGVLGLLILTALALTSNRWSMRRLGRNWKRLHRLVYPAGVAVVFHAILATSQSKRIFIRDPQAIHELRIYLGLLAVLLIVRIPLIRRVLKRWLVQPRPQRTADVRVVFVPAATPDHWPRAHEHKGDISPDDPPGEVKPEEENEKVLVP